MGTLDLKGKAPQMPKDLDDKKLADLYKKLEKQLAAWPAAAKALQGVASECLGAVTEVGVLAADKAKDKKTPPDQKAAYQKAFDAAYAYGKQFHDML